jgi:hypothetical protein
VLERVNRLRPRYKFHRNCSAKTKRNRRLRPRAVPRRHRSLHARRATRVQLVLVPALFNRVRDRLPWKHRLSQFALNVFAWSWSRTRGHPIRTREAQQSGDWRHKWQFPHLV